MASSESTLRLLRDLVAIDSVNPALAPGGAGEARIAERVAAELERLGLTVSVEEAAPGRPNVVGVLQGARAGRSLLLCGHLDTVGVEGMPAPFTPLERDGRLYGRGAQDMKGGVAAILGAVDALVSEGGLAKGRVVVGCVADEEHASLGAEALVERWRADAAIVAEPTDLAVAVGHKGFSWAEVETFGRAAHGSRPEEGRDAIVDMGRVLAGLERLSAELSARPPDPLLGTGSLHASMIEGGRELSTYPDRCRLRMERRIVVGEEVNAAARELERLVARLHEEDPGFRASVRFLFGRSAYRTPDSSPLPDLLLRALERAGRTVSRAAMTYWTDAAILGEAGIPSVVFGPGGAGLHGLEEHVRVDEVLACRDAIAAVAREFCSSESAGLE